MPECASLCSSTADCQRGWHQTAHGAHLPGGRASSTGGPSPLISHIFSNVINSQFYFIFLLIHKYIIDTLLHIPLYIHENI